MYRIVADHAYDIDSDQIRDNFSVMQRLWLGKGAGGPFDNALGQIKGVHEALESWELALDEESEILFQDLLGVQPGDEVEYSTKGKNVRIRLNRTSMAVWRTRSSKFWTVHVIDNTAFPEKEKNP